LLPTDPAALNGGDREERFDGDLDAVVSAYGVDYTRSVGTGVHREKSEVVSLKAQREGYHLEGTLCPIVVHGSVHRRFLTYMKSTLHHIADTIIGHVEKLCENGAMHDGQRLRALQNKVFEIRNRTVPSWTEHAHPDDGASTAELLEKVTSGPVAAVLDYGSGDGTDLAAVASHFGLARDVAVGVDVDPDSMLPQNKAHVTFWHLKRPLDAGLAKLQSTYESKISVAWAFGVLHHIPEDDILQQTLQTLAAVLKPGGALAIQEWALPVKGSDNDVAIFYDWVHLLNGAFFFPPSNTTGDSSHRRPVHSIGTMYRKIEEWHSLMAEVGLEFSLERSRLGSGGMEPADEADQSTTGGFLAVYLKPDV
jgi:SAM-dependent methyltransferase